MNANKNILLVEDDLNFGSLLQNYLKLSGYYVEWCKNGAVGYSTFCNHHFDLCILDVMMPIMDGFSLAEKIKEKNSVPIIFLTARDLKEDIIKGYKLWADDYLNKPFDVEVLLLKLEVLFNKSRSTEKKLQYEIGNYQFNITTRNLTDGSKNQKLSPKESALLEMLCIHINDIMPREEALKKIWKEDNYFTTRSMDVYITKLRKHLKADTSVRIENIHSKGYGLFVGE